MYESPYMGTTAWGLTPDGDFQIGDMQPLPVERDPETWTWIIGRGSATVYVSQPA